MVAYAYNGGIGFVTRKVKPSFKYDGKFEPFLSMELVAYDESREYGKKVLANYVIYSHLFGDRNVTLHGLLKK
jgi:soluble lytic murein transglycosylase